jgi:hypothetical protein
VLDSDALAVEAVMRVGDVAGGEHARGAGPQALVDDDPVLDREAGARGQGGPGSHHDTDDDHVAVERPPVARAHPLDPPVSLERVDPGPEQHPQP